jgi:hypothetical protein
MSILRGVSELLRIGESKSESNLRLVTSPEYWRMLMDANPELIEYATMKRCQDWTLRANALGGLGLMNHRVVQDDLSGWMMSRFGVYQHVWLDVVTKDREIFVADGTAGQFGSVVNGGYFGLLKQAPDVLKDIYNLRYHHLK